MPKRIQEEFKSILVSIPFQDSFHEEGTGVNTAPIKQLRETSIHAIQDEFAKWLPRPADSRHQGKARSAAR